MRHVMDRQSMAGDSRTANHALIVRHYVANDGDDIENSVRAGNYGHCRPPAINWDWTVDCYLVGAIRPNRDETVLFTSFRNWNGYQKPLTGLLYFTMRARIF